MLNLRFENSILYFTFGNDFSEKDFQEFLSILTKMLDKGKKFSIFVDARDAHIAPVSSGIMLLNWMKKNKHRVKGVISSSVIILTSEKITSILKWVFSKQTPVSPNLITTKYDEGVEFTNNHLNH